MRYLIKKLPIISNLVRISPSELRANQPQPINRHLPRQLAKSFTILASCVFLAVGMANADDDECHYNGDDGSGNCLQHADGSPPHLPATNFNVELVSKLKLTEVEGGIGDVAAYGNYAYINHYQPECSVPGGAGRTGVDIVDISDPANPVNLSVAPYLPGHQLAVFPNTRPSEGAHVIHIETQHFKGEVLIVNNEPCNSTLRYRGGTTLYDVTNPAAPELLSGGETGVGDPTSTVETAIGGVGSTHSAFGWYVPEPNELHPEGPSAYIMQVENGMQGTGDIDIIDITDPRNPVFLTSKGIPDYPQASPKVEQGNWSYNHDFQVKKINAHWYAALSYWDHGWVVLNVDNPANPTYVSDYDFPEDPDTLLPKNPSNGQPQLAQGDSHQVWWSSDGKTLIGTQETPSARFSNPFTCSGKPSSDLIDFSCLGGGWSVISLAPNGVWRGTGTAANNFEMHYIAAGVISELAQTTDAETGEPYFGFGGGQNLVWGGSGCNSDVDGNGINDRTAVMDATANLSKKGGIVFVRGTCTFSEKAQTGANAGYPLVYIVNSHLGTNFGSTPDAIPSTSGSIANVPEPNKYPQEFKDLFPETYKAVYPPPSDVGSAAYTTWKTKFDNSYPVPFVMAITHAVAHTLFGVPNPTYSGPDITSGGDLTNIPIGKQAKFKLEVFYSPDALFSGWGYARFMDFDENSSNFMKEVAAYAIPEALNPALVPGRVGRCYTQAGEIVKPTCGTSQANATDSALPPAFPDANYTCPAGSGTLQCPVGSRTTTPITSTCIKDGQIVAPLTSTTCPLGSNFATPGNSNRVAYLTAHEVQTDDRPGVNLAYFSWYKGGFRAVKFGEGVPDIDTSGSGPGKCLDPALNPPPPYADPTGLTTELQPSTAPACIKGRVQEVAKFIDATDDHNDGHHNGGNDFWGVEPVHIPNAPGGDDRPYILLSDRDYGLYIVRVNDNDKPTITITTPAVNDVYLLNQNVTANFECKDDIGGSGIGSCTAKVDGNSIGAALPTGTVGTHTIEVTTVDKVGNTTTASRTYKVIYRFDGFLQPINDTAHTLTCGSPCVASLFKGGSTVPVKFQLKDANGVVVQSATAPLWLAPVKGNAMAAGVDEGAYGDHPPSSGPTYRSSGLEYIYNWSTKGFAAGYFWRIGVTLNDGQTYFENIGLK